MMLIIVYLIMYLVYSFIIGIFALEYSKTSIPSWMNILIWIGYPTYFVFGFILWGYEGFMEWKTLRRKPK
jgi:hypothetical protein